MKNPYQHSFKYMSQPKECAKCKGKRILSAHYSSVPNMSQQISNYKGSLFVWFCVNCGEVLGLVDDRPDPMSLAVAQERASYGDQYDFKHIEV